MSTVEDFIYHYEGHQHEIMLFFHQMLTTEFNLRDKIRYKIPFYYGHSWVCYLNPIKSTGVEFAFLRGNELSNSQGLLESKGRKQVLGATFTTVADIPKQTISEIIHEAILLDESKPYASKRFTKK